MSAARRGKTHRRLREPRPDRLPNVASIPVTEHTDVDIDTADAGTPLPADSSGDAEALEMLRAILLEQSRQRLHELQGEVDKLQYLLELLEDQVNDEEALIATIKPVIADAISSSISDSRDEMIEALYPITGRLVSKAVTEAMRDLVRNIDNQMRNAFSFAGFKRQVQARAGGVSHAEMTLRSALPFTVEDLFLIHRDSGLLINYLSRTGQAQSDSDLISGMLTAIRDFAQDAFGRGEEGHLEEIHYGDLRILIEAGKYAYIAAVVEGFEPMGYRTQVRDVLYRIEHNNFRLLRRYDGDPSALADTQNELRSLMMEQVQGRDAGAVARQASRSAAQQRVSWTPRAIFFLLLCVVVFFLFMWRMWTIFGSVLTLASLSGIWPL